MKGFKDSNNKFHPISQYQKIRKSSDQKEVGIRLRRDKKIPVYNTKVNWDDKRKPFKMWIVKHPEGSDVVKGSVTIVMAEHFGQAVDDFETIWNKENRMNRKIGYPVIQGTADKNFRYKRDAIRKARENHSRTKPYAGEILTGNPIHDLRILQRLNAHDGSVEDVDGLDKLQREKLWKIMTSDEAFGVDHRSEAEMRNFYNNLSDKWKKQYGVVERNYNKKTDKYEISAKPENWNDLTHGDQSLMKLIVWRFNEPASSDNWFEMYKEVNGKVIRNRDPIKD